MHSYRLLEDELEGFEFLTNLLTEERTEQDMLITLGEKLEGARFSRTEHQKYATIELSDEELDYVLDVIHSKLDSAPNRELTALLDGIVRQTNGGHLTEWKGTQELKSII